MSPPPSAALALKSAYLPRGGPVASSSSLPAATLARNRNSDASFCVSLQRRVKTLAEQVAGKEGGKVDDDGFLARGEGARIRPGRSAQDANS